MKLDLTKILHSPVFSELDRRFAQLMERQDGKASPWIGVAAAVASYQLRRGQVFLDLDRAPAWDDPKEVPLDDWPPIEIWRAELEGSPTVGGPGEAKPLILTGGKLYLHRYWFYEKQLADNLRARSVVRRTGLSGEELKRLDTLFANAPEQKEAARNALIRNFSLISGGPGTGKTTTVLKILILLLEENPDLVVQLAAPTGKAAARLQESIRGGLRQIPGCPADIRQQVERQETSTIHRLLGPISGSVFFRHNAENPLPADVVVLDEASMVDLPLMAKLFAALPDDCRVIVLGDKDQLASVEAGSVLSGIVEAAEDVPENENAAPLAGVATLLNQNFRFGNESGIYRLCNAVRSGDHEGVLATFRGSTGDLSWQELPAAGVLKEKLRPLVVKHLGAFLEKTDPEEALDAFGRFQVLTALRQGPFGKENLNLLVEEILREEGLIQVGRRDFPGRPLMVTENDYTVRLFNGDIGILLEDEEGKLMAFFRSEDGTIRKISPLRLPFAEPAFAMTVHKSQGSEFDEVLTILPTRDTRVLTRELVYTAISRAKTRVGLWSSEEILRAAVGRKVSRASGLAGMLRNE